MVNKITELDKLREQIELLKKELDTQLSKGITKEELYKLRYEKVRNYTSIVNLLLGIFNWIKVFI